MKIETVEERLNENGLKLERLYNCFSPCFSVLHSEACRDFLERPISHHEHYCDMKRLESLEMGGIAFGIYNPITGFSTEIKTDDAVEKVVKLIQHGFVEHVLIFELTGHLKSGVLPTPAGKVYKIVSV